MASRIALITSKPDVLGGRAVFRGTRVPVDIVFESLADGSSLTEILDSFPTLNAQDVRDVLREASASVQSATTPKLRRLAS
jgi:uncharacterized protein (DUF433 family)